MVLVNLFAFLLEYYLYYGIRYCQTYPGIEVDGLNDY